jgi:erythromycin esterase-like protein
MERKRVRDALPGSYERLFRESEAGRFYVDVAGEEAGRPLAGPLLERAIGLIYRPHTERWSHYFVARLPRQFDVMIHLDRTEALVPLDRSAGWDEGEPPETWPTAL